VNGVVECFRLAVAPGIRISLPGYLAVLIPQADGHHPVVQFVVVGRLSGRSDPTSGRASSGGPVRSSRAGRRSG